MVIPVYNEALGLAAFHDSLMEVLRSLDTSYEVIYADDGSTDDTSELVRGWHVDDGRVKLVRLSRNFGKENVLTAGIAAARGEAIITLDGDGQHPVELIPQFVKKWQEGAQVVVGVRTANKNASWSRRLASRLFYKLFNALTGQKLLPGSTDYRLIDRAVQRTFLELKEPDRITRGLIDWLGFKRELVHFKANARAAGTARYGRGKLLQLAANSFVSLSPTPLYLFGYLGIFITLGALALGLAVLVEQLIAGDPWHWNFTGTAMLGILILFLVGIVLLSQGILSLYISHIHNQTRQRQLYVIDYKTSVGIERPDGF